MKKLLAIALFLGGSYLGHAQLTQTATQATEVVIGQILDITYTAGNATETFTFSALNDFNNGLSTAANVSSLEVKSNKTYTVSVSAPNFTNVGSSTTTMPPTVLGVTADNGSNYTTVTTGGANLVTSGSVGTTTFPIGFQANPGFDYEPDTYNTTITFTVSAP